LDGNVPPTTVNGNTVYPKRIWFMTDQPKLTAEERGKRVQSRLNEEIGIPPVITERPTLIEEIATDEIRQAEDAVQEECARIAWDAVNLPTPKCGPCEHGCEARIAQAIREGK